MFLFCKLQLVMFFVTFPLSDKKKTKLDVLNLQLLFVTVRSKQGQFFLNALQYSFKRFLLQTHVS